MYSCFINFTGNELAKRFRLYIIESFPYHALTNTRSNEFFFSTREPVRSQRSYEQRAGYFFGIRSPFLNNAPLQSRLQLRINFQLLLKPSGSFISRARSISVSDGFDTATFKNFYYARFASVRSTKRKEKGNFRQNEIRSNNERFPFLSKYQIEMNNISVPFSRLVKRISYINENTFACSHDGRLVSVL